MKLQFIVISCVVILLLGCRSDKTKSKPNVQQSINVDSIANKKQVIKPVFKDTVENIITISEKKLPQTELATPLKKKRNLMTNCNKKDYDIKISDSIACVVEIPPNRRKLVVPFVWNIYNDTLVVKPKYGSCINALYFIINDGCVEYIGHTFFSSDDVIVEDYDDKGERIPPKRFNKVKWLKEPNKTNYFMLQEWSKNERIVGTITYLTQGSRKVDMKFWIEFKKHNRAKKK